MSRRSSTGLAHSLQWYCNNYGLSLSTIRRAKARSWPLDDPEALAKKLFESPGRTVRLRKLHEFARGRAVEGTEQPPNLSADLESGLRYELARLKTEAKRAYDAYVKETDPLEAAPRQKLWLALVAQLTALAKIAPKADQDAGESLPRQEVEAAWTRAGQELRSNLDQVPRRLSLNPFFRKLDPVAMEAVVQAEMNALAVAFEAGFAMASEKAATKQKRGSTAKEAKS